MELIRRAARLMGWSGLLLVPGVAASWGLGAALGLVGGMLWALANVWALSQLTQGSLSAQPHRRWKQVCLWLIKLPLLYLVGAWLLLNPWGSPLGFLVGFSWWFVALLASAMLGVAASR